MKQPTGLTIARNGLSFTLSWKVSGTAKTYKQKYLYVFLKVDGKWKNYNKVAISDTLKSYVYKVKQDDYYPVKTKKLEGIYFGIDFQSNAGDLLVNKVVYSSSFLLSPPSKPTVSVAVDENVENRRTLSATCSYALNDKKPWKQMEYKTILVKNWNGSEANPNVAWGDNTVTGSTSWSSTGVEDSNQLRNESFTRLVRARVKGIAGDSAYSYAHHTFATPKQATITEGGVTPADGRFAGTVKWTPNNSDKFPVATFDIQYSKGVPLIELTGVKSDGTWTGVNISRKEGSWETVGTVAPKGNPAGYDFNVNETIGLDECIWFQIKSNYDKKSNYSDAFLVKTKGKAGKLSPPSLNTPSINGTTARITINRTTEVENSFVLVSLQIGKSKEWKDIGVIKSGYDSGEFNCPNVGENDYKIKIQEIVGTYTKTQKEGWIEHTVKDKLMESVEVISDSATMPKPPKNLSVTQSTASTVKLTWEWSWNDANEATISWADHEDAWESTDGPNDYEIKKRATSWTVANLDSDESYYFRAKLRNTTGEDEIESDWSNSVQITLSSELVKPAIGFNKYLFNIDEPILCTCSYTSSGNVTIEVAEIVNDVVGPVLIQSNSSVFELNIADVNKILKEKNKILWGTGTEHSLVCRLSKGGKDATEWSEPETFSIIPSIEMTSNSHNLDTMTITEDDEERTILALKRLPLVVSAIGAGDNGKTKVFVKRANGYTVARPTEKNEARFENEIIVSKSADGDAEISIEYDDLIGALDDGASYNLIIEIEDVYKQTVSVEYLFEVHWEHQPQMPSFEYIMDEEKKAYIFLGQQPSNYQEGDTFDVYRLSSDLPELILENGEYGVTYVDPYPAFGKMGGHRFVNKTINGDYVTEDNEMAWADTGQNGGDGDFLDYKKAVIDFDGNQIELEFNIDLSNSWNKDFKQTVYLGGSVEGDWNPAVTRSLNLDAIHLEVFDDDTIEGIRRLANHAGICHVRTPDGSSFACDIQVTEKKSHDNKVRRDYSFSINRVDTQGLDVVTLEEWNSRTEAQDGLE